MFERFDQGARQVVLHAQEQARALGHHEIGALHFLLGCFEARYGGRGRPYTKAREALRRAHVVRDHVIVAAHGEHVIQHPPASRRPERREPPSQIPFTDEAKRVLELALRESLSAGHTSIRAEHILMALTRVDGAQGVLAPLTLRECIADIWLGRPAARKDR